MTPWTAAHQAPLSLEFPRQEYRGMLPFPSLGDLPDSETKPSSPVLQVDSLPLNHQESPKSTLFQFKKERDACDPNKSMYKGTGRWSQVPGQNLGCSVEYK